MLCSDVTRRLSALLDARLDDRARARIQAHLDECTACRQSVARLARAERALGAVGPAAPPPDMAARATRAALQARPDPRLHMADSLADSLLHLAWPAAVAAALAALILCLGVGLGDPPGRATATAGDDPVGEVALFPYHLSDPTAALLGDASWQ